MEPASTLVCAGCGHRIDARETLPFSCPRAGGGDDVDHVLERRLDPELLGGAEAGRRLFLDREPNPFLKYRRLLHSYQTAVSLGLADSEFVALVRELDAAVERVDGRGFRETPLARDPGLERWLGVDELWVKDETGNVGDSHKSRHLMGTAVALEAAARLRPDDPRLRSRLAIASCGNAALAAAIVARAANRPLDVFVPRNANPAILERFPALAVEPTVCPRRTGEVGDPAYLRFREALAAGDLPFGVQGPDNALTLEGGATLAWEMAAGLLRVGAEIDRLLIQVGGGALASACVQGLIEAQALGALARLPRIHAVQTRASPLKRAYDRVIEWILDRWRCQSGDSPPGPGRRAERAAFVRDRVPPGLLAEAIDHAAGHRSRFMWPWHGELRSVASNILDDETYDWLAIVRAMLATGGWPLAVSEARLAEANRRAREATGKPIGASGSAGLAGLSSLRLAGDLAPHERAAILLTGIQR